MREHVALAPLTTMQVGGSVDYFVAARTRGAVEAACEWAAEHKLPVLVLGEGSNMIVSDGPLHRLALKIELPGFEVTAQDNDSATVVVGAGEHWDGVVERCVKLGLAGVEALSMVPGTAGATPVQNVGAYGAEIAGTLTELEAYDTKEREFVRIGHDDCAFGYRSSRFREEDAGRFVIVSITLALSKRPPAPPVYESLRRHLAEQGITEPTLAQIRDGVMAVRKRILPDPSVVPNTGSFFKNPIVDAAKLRQLETRFERVPSYTYGDKFKLAAGWIVEECGFKGQEHFGFALWPQHALVITNSNHAGYTDLMKLVELIVRSAQEKFGITLEPEPLFVR